MSDMVGSTSSYASISTAPHFIKAHNSIDHKEGGNSCKKVLKKVKSDWIETGKIYIFALFYYAVSIYGAEW